MRKHSVIQTVREDLEVLHPLNHSFDVNPDGSNLLGSRHLLLGKLLLACLGSWWDDGENPIHLKSRKALIGRYFIIVFEQLEESRVSSNKGVRRMATISSGDEGDQAR